MCFLFLGPLCLFKHSSETDKITKPEMINNYQSYPVEVKDIVNETLFKEFNSELTKNNKSTNTESKTESSQPKINNIIENNG